MENLQQEHHKVTNSRVYNLPFSNTPVQVDPTLDRIILQWLFLVVCIHPDLYRKRGATIEAVCTRILDFSLP